MKYKSELNIVVKQPCYCLPCQVGESCLGTALSAPLTGSDFFRIQNYYYYSFRAFDQTGDSYAVARFISQIGICQESVN